MVVGLMKINNDFIKRTSKLFLILGAVTCIYNTLLMLFFNKVNTINIVTLIAIIVILVILYIFGIKKQTKFIAWLQIIVTYIILAVSFFTNPGNISGMVFAIINYLLLNEYKMIKSIIAKIIVVAFYIMPIIFSIFILGNSPEPYIDIYMIMVFFVFFIKGYIEYKSSEEIQKTKAAVELIEAIRKDNREVREIAKHTIEILNHQKNCIEKL